MRMIALKYTLAAPGRGPATSVREVRSRRGVEKTVKASRSQLGAGGEKGHESAAAVRI